MQLKGHDVTLPSTAERLPKIQSKNKAVFDAKHIKAEPATGHNFQIDNSSATISDIAEVDKELDDLEAEARAALDDVDAEAGIE